MNEIEFHFGNTSVAPTVVQGATCAPIITNAMIEMTAEVIQMETGNDAVLTATFRDANGALIDPAAITLIVQDPTGVQTTYTYPSASITRLALGVFRQIIDVEIFGRWLFKWASPNTPHATGSGFFDVTASAF